MRTGKYSSRSTWTAILAVVLLLGSDVAISQVSSTLLPSSGYPLFVSPHSKPIAIQGNHVYVVNTPSDTVDVFSMATQTIVTRVSVGVDPVGLAVKPDGTEVWVTNHVSDNISVIDSDIDSRTLWNVIATIQDFNTDTLQTEFDEPVGVAFANDEKAYVALSPLNEIAVINVESRTATKRIDITAQDPRSITVRGNKLYVIPFESNNQTQLSGCTAEKIDGSTCTFDAVEHVFRNNNVLSLDYDADIVVNTDLPDRDLYIYNTTNEILDEVVSGVGTLLYDLTVDSKGRAFVAQTDARNAENGRAGTLKHGLAEMENRAFLNQVTMVDCQSGCNAPVRVDLEPLPPENPAQDMALAMPYGIQISDDDSTLFVTAAGSDKLFTMDAETNAILGRVDVEAVPRGIALESDDEGAATKAWILNAVQNSVSIVNVSDPENMTLIKSVALVDHTDPEVKLGRIAFEDANLSSTGTFSCASCHPDGHTDQLIWVLQTPACGGDNDDLRDGCTQIPPRLTMPIRGARDTQPYHWDGIPGDPYGGNNTPNITSDVEPNCEIDDPEGCVRVLVDGSLSTTMCDVNNCPEGEDGLVGLGTEEERSAMSKFVLSVPHPPAPERPFNNELSAQAREGYIEFNMEKDCGTCHRNPFLVSTNTGGTGMDAPSWRSANDRWMILPQGRLNIIDLMNIASIPNDFPERNIWILAGANPEIWQMVLELGNGFSGAFGRQVTLSSSTVDDEKTTLLLDTLEESASEGGIVLQGEGVILIGDETTLQLNIPVEFEYRDGAYYFKGYDLSFPRDVLLAFVNHDLMMLTLTGRAGRNTDYDHPQPGIWPLGEIQAQTGVINFALIDDDLTLRLNGRHIHPDAHVIIDGRRTNGEVRCEEGQLPDCVGEIILVQLADLPDVGGVHFLQVQNKDGMFSNDAIIFNDQSEIPATTRNLIGSGGHFGNGEANWRSNEIAGSVDFRDGRVFLNITDIDEGTQPWFIELSHGVMLVKDQEYTLCYDARADASRTFRTRIDRGADQYQSFLHEDFNITPTSTQYKHTITPEITDITSRVVFNAAQSEIDVQLDNIGLYEGSECRTP